MDDLNKLNKNQIILLTLLVSFVTSIATGIVTVTLIQQAPQSLTQPVNQVILRTVERVVSDGKPQTVIKEVPVIVTEEQLIIKVVNAAGPAVVTISGASVGTTTESVLSVGFLAKGNNLVVASNRAGLVAKQTYKVTTADGKVIDAELISEPSSVVAILRLTQSVGVEPLVFSEGDLAVGQTVIALGSTGAEASAIAVGIISLVTTDDTTKETRLRTSAANIDNIGAPMLNVQGKVVGLSEGAGLAISQKQIKQAVDSIKN